MTAALESRVIAVPDLTPAEVDAMYALFDAHFHASPEVFARDLASKGWVILFHDTAPANAANPANAATAEGLQGFTTLALYETTAQGRRLSVVYSGDTLIRPAFWGTPALPRAWIKTVLALSAGRRQPVYWLLLASGYKTYRFLPVFFAEFYPRHDRPMPPAAQGLLEELAAERFGPDFKREQGIVRFTRGATPLRSGIADVTPERLKDPQVAFYQARNPGHSAGDELVCLTRIHVENLTAAGRRMTR
jgi:hypothetical protein